MEKGILFCKDHLSSLEKSVNLLNPSDTSLLKQNPFVVGNLISCGNAFLIPCDAVPEDDEILKLKCYSPRTPPVIFPEKNSNSYEKRMEGPGVTLLRIAMMPLPVIVDAATLPFQMIGLLLVYCTRC